MKDHIVFFLLFLIYPCILDDGNMHFFFKFDVLCGFDCGFVRRGGSFIITKKENKYLILYL